MVQMRGAVSGLLSPRIRQIAQETAGQFVARRVRATAPPTRRGQRHQIESHEYRRVGARPATELVGVARIQRGQRAAVHGTRGRPGEKSQNR